jgi:predicted RNA-binding protein
MLKRVTLGYLPGGNDRYIDSLAKTLEFVQKSNPSEEQFRGWFLQTFYSVKSMTVVKSCIGTIESLELIVKSKGTFSLSEIAREFMQTRNNNLVYQKLTTNYLGIDDILRLLCQKAQTLQEISTSLSQKVGKSWKGMTQWTIRLNWLQSLGYVSKIGRRYSLTKEGNSLVESEIEPEAKIPEHPEIVKLIVETGRVLDVIAEEEYPTDGRFVDVVYKETERANPFAVFEVNLKENPSEALTRLKLARVNLRSEQLYLVTPRKYMLKAENMIKTAYREISELVQIVDWTDIERLKNSALEFKEEAKRMKIEPKFVFRRKFSAGGHLNIKS